MSPSHGLYIKVLNVNIIDMISKRRSQQCFQRNYARTVPLTRMESFRTDFEATEVILFTSCCIPSYSGTYSPIHLVIVKPGKRRTETVFWRSGCKLLLPILYPGLKTFSGQFTGSISLVIRKTDSQPTGGSSYCCFKALAISLTHSSRSSLSCINAYIHRCLDGQRWIYPPLSHLYGINLVHQMI